MVPNTTILNSVPGIDKGGFQFNKLLLEPLNLLRNLKFVSEFVELGSQRSDNRLSRRHVS